MIEPTVGRVVWFYRFRFAGPNVTPKHSGPLAAIIAAVESAERVTLMVIDRFGQPLGHCGVLLLQEDGAPDEDYCTWMPYQKGQAQKAEELEKKLAKKKKADKADEPSTSQ